MGKKYSQKNGINQLLPIVALLLLVLPVLLNAQTEGVYSIDKFNFENGAVINNMKVGYVTWGKLNDAKDNAILLLPGSSNGRHFADAHIGPGKTYDTDKYFIIGVDPIGGGNSSQPKDGMGIDFPKYSVRDMVHAQYLLITKGLGLTHLLVVAGPSMGSFQSLEWGINYPDFVAGLVLIVPGARMDNHFKPIMDAFQTVINLDPKYKEGRYTENPIDGVSAAALIFLPWALSDEYLASLDENTYNKLKTATCQVWAKEWDANSLLWRFNASGTYNASVPFGGDMKKALNQVKAKALLLYCAKDRIIPDYLTQELYKGLKDAACIEIPSVFGHMAGVRPPGTAEYNFVSAKVKEFLSQLKK